MHNHKVYKDLRNFSGMVKISIIKQSQQGMNAGIEHLSTGRYESAKQLFEGVITTIEQSNLYGKHNAHYKTHKRYLHAATFGQGFAEGLMERETSPGRTLDDLANSAKEFQEAATLPRSQTETHRKIGKAYGALGLKKEGLKILDESRKRHIITCYYGKTEIMKMNE